MQSTRAIASRLTIATDTETTESKDNFDEPRKYFNKLAHNLVCCENIYNQHIILKDDDTIKTDDTERQMLLLHIREDSDVDLAKFVDATIDAKSAMFPTLFETFISLNQSLATTLTKTDRLAAYHSVLIAVRQMLSHVERINTILDVMPRVIFSQQNENFPGVAKAKLEAEKVYELIKANRKMFSAQYGTQVSNNCILTSKADSPAPVAQQTKPLNGFGKCHV